MFDSKKVANGIGRTISATYGVYEGQFVDGVPLGFGNIIDTKLNHYEGFLKVSSEGLIIGHGVGTFMSSDNTY